MTLPPLLLTGGPAAGKTTTVLRLAERTPRCACIDVDNVRQLVKNGGAAPWDGDEGRTQQMLGVRNAVALASNFMASGLAVTMSDVVTERTLGAYRDALPGLVIVRLLIGIDEARRRAGTRPVYLTDAEFAHLHEQQSEPLAVDYEIDVTGLSLDEQVEAVRTRWTTRPA